MIHEVLVEVCAGCGWLPGLCKCKWPAQYAMLEQVHTMRKIAAAKDNEPQPPELPPRFAQQIWPVIRRA